MALLAFAGAVYAGYTVLAIGSGRARRTQFNWVVTGVGAAVNVGLNFWLVPAYGMVGAAISTLVAYVVLFVGMTLYAQRVYPVAYQWRRVLTCLGAGVGLTVAARVPYLPLAPSLLLVARVPARARACSASTCRPSGSGCGRAIAAAFSALTPQSAGSAPTRRLRRSPAPAPASSRPRSPTRPRASPSRPPIATSSSDTPRSSA